MILLLDTTTKNCRAAIYCKGKKFETDWTSQELTLELLEKITGVLSSANSQLKDLTAIAVCHGEGSFTGTRIGVSIANALSFSLKIPVYGYDAGQDPDSVLKEIKANPRKFGQFCQVKYSAPPKITLPKSL